MLDKMKFAQSETAKRSKQQQAQYFYYVEQLCVCHCVYRVFSLSLATGAEIVLFNQLMKKTFDEECVGDLALSLQDIAQIKF